MDAAETITQVAQGKIAEACSWRVNAASAEDLATAGKLKLAAAEKLLDVAEAHERLLACSQLIRLALLNEAVVLDEASEGEEPAEPEDDDVVE